MKKLLAMLLVLSACTSWNQKDFKKDLEKGSEAEAQPTVSTETEKQVLEKFEVEDVKEEKKPEAVKNEAAPNPKVKIEIKKAAPKVTTKPAVKAPQTPPKAAAKVLPADYPAEMLEMNAKAKAVWDLYRPNHRVDEKSYLDIHYLGMTVGKIMVANKGKKMINGKEVWHFHARFKSAPFYSNIYELDDSVDTYVTTDQFLSIKYSLIQRETKQDVDDLQLYDRDQMKTLWFYHQKKSDGTIRDKKEDKYMPFYSVDPFSVVFFYQGLPLKNGDIYEIPIVNKTKILILRSQVEGREKIETEKGKRNAIRIHATTKYTGETLKSGDMYFWFSDDEKRTLLKAQAKIKIGSVTGDIVE